MYILCDDASPRLHYALDIIFNLHLQIDFEVIDSLDVAPRRAMLINYSKYKTERKNISIYPHPILNEDNIYAQRIRVSRGEEDLPYFFASYDFKGDYYFDLFALVFYMVSRYEEYLRFVPDEFGRFRSSQSLAYRNNFLKVPIADKWILHLKKSIERKWQIKIPLKRKLEIRPTFDIDIPFAFIHRPYWMHIPLIIRDLVMFRFKILNARLSTLLQLRKDDFDTYEKIDALLKTYKTKATYFVLMRFRYPHDLNYSWRSDAFSILVRRLTSKTFFGIHPSIYSHNGIKYLKEEIIRLGRKSGKEVVRSRQHYLSIKLPETYEKLLELGIEEDYSMGFHDRSGFRAGTCLPFPWYNLKEEKQTDLMIHPFQIMDATLRRHQGKSSTEAIEEIAGIKTEISAVHGQFSFIWHNSSFSKIYGWEGWEEVLESCLEGNLNH